jgi:hypothetical protein
MLEIILLYYYKMGKITKKNNNKGKLNYLRSKTYKKKSKQMRKKTKSKQVRRKTKSKQVRRKTKSKQIRRKTKSKQVRRKTKSKQIRRKIKGGAILEMVSDRQKAFLHKMCSNNRCLPIGQYTEITNDYFDYMHLKHATGKVQAVGDNSANGFIRRIELEKNNYSTVTMLKSSKSKTSDNLMYEYLVGLFINNYNLIFPCFLQTYACYQYKNEDQYNTFRDNQQTIKDVNELTPLFSYNSQKSNQQTANMLIDKSCEQPQHICLLVQYLENPVSLHDLLVKFHTDEYFCRVELIQLLLQIFIPLGMMETKFTHNDLHSNNVLVYLIPNNGYVTMNYKTPYGNVSFQTTYICKIIDYGRCYFKDTQMSSENIRRILCKNSKCGNGCDTSFFCNRASSCGEDVGYTFIDQDLEDYNFNMSSSKNNPGKDLWLIQNLKIVIPHISNSILSSHVRDLINGVTGESNQYGKNYYTLSAENPDNTIYSVYDFMKKTIECYNKVLPDIEDRKKVGLYGHKHSAGTFTIDAVTNSDYVYATDPVASEYH